MSKDWRSKAATYLSFPIQNQIKNTSNLNTHTRMHEQSKNHISRPRCYAKSSTVQDVFQSIPGHTHTHMHVCMHIHMHAHPHMPHTHKHAHTYTCTHTHTWPAAVFLCVMEEAMQVIFTTGSACSNCASTLTPD